MQPPARRWTIFYRKPVMPILGSFDSTYESRIWDTYLLESSQYATASANGSVQDLMYVAPIPETSTLMGAGALAGLIATRLARRRRAYSAKS